MPNYSKSLLIFALFAVLWLWLENKAHHCGFTHEKTHKKFDKGKTSTTTSTPAIKFDSKCNTSTVPSCQCTSLSMYPQDLYYAVPKSGNCTDVFKRLPTTPDYHFREENCHKVQRPVCRVDSSCYNITFNQQLGTPPPSPDEFVFCQNASKPFCQCGIINDRPMPKSGNCTIYNNQSAAGLGCYKAETLCTDTCYCNNNNFYIDPTKCDPQTCNNAAKPFCICGTGATANYYPLPESGNCTDVNFLKQHFSTTPAYYYKLGFDCIKARNVCKCTLWPETHCECNDFCVSCVSGSGS